MDHPYYPNVLVTCEAVPSLVESGARLIQVDVNPEAFGHGHIEGAISWDWHGLKDEQTGDIINLSQFAQLMSQSGVANDTLVLLYGDNNNWFAFWAYWLLKLYGHENVRVIDGGLNRWLRCGYMLSTEEAHYDDQPYEERSNNQGLRASLEDVFEAMFDPDHKRLLDVRSSAEFEGKLSGAGLGAEVTCQAGGHIPTAVNIPWNLNCNLDGTLKGPEELQAVYDGFGVRRDMSVITYCAIGERSSVAWFVLKELLGYEAVQNYDRSMSSYTQLRHTPVVSHNQPILKRA